MVVYFVMSKIMQATHYQILTFKGADVHNNLSQSFNPYMFTHDFSCIHTTTWEMPLQLSAYSAVCIIEPKMCTLELATLVLYF